LPAIHLVRHGHHPLIGRALAGRMAKVDLDDQGRREMTAAASTLRAIGSFRLQSSPQPRTMQSADIIATSCGCSVETAPSFDEIDVGDWTGLTFDRLDNDAGWRRWNAHRDVARPPNGESMAELQCRVTQHLESLRQDETPVVIVSHAEPIRAALMHYLGVPLRRFYDLEIAPASISTIVLEATWTTVSHVSGQTVSAGDSKDNAAEERCSR
jgi:broad specificity phosphatase PhoE